MIDDRNLFRPRGGRADVVEMAAHLDVERASYVARLDDVEAQIAVRLDRVDRVIDALEDRRNTLTAQVLLLTPGVFDLAELGTRRDAAESFIAAIESFMLRAGNLRAKCLNTSTPAAERLALAERFEVAAVHILRTAEGTSPLTDLSDDLKELASGIATTTADLAKQGLGTLEVVAIAAAVVAFVYLVKG